MEDTELILLIKKEIKGSLARNPSIIANFNELGQLFFDFLRLPINDVQSEIQGCSRILNAIIKLLDGNIDKKDRDTFLSEICKIEPVLRKILLYEDKKEFLNIELSKDGFMPLVRALKLNPSEVNFSNSLPKHYDSSKFYIDHFIKAYKVRNIESHKLKDYSSREAGEIIESSLMIYLYLIDKFKHSIKKAILDYSEVKLPEFNDYCDKIIADFKNRIGKIVHLNSKENITLSSTYVSEALINLDEDREIPIREGTVDELRRTKVSENRMIIWGDAGMGKTTTMEYLAYKDALEYKKATENNIPVFVPLGFLTDFNLSIKQYIYSKLNVSDNIGAAMLEKGKLNLFLDGINEIPRDEKNLLRSIRYKEIDRLIESSSKSFILVSNRPDDVNMFSKAPIFIIQKMNDSQIFDFINRYGDNQKEICNLLKEKISNDERLREIVRTPLMLSRLIEILKSDGVIPENEPKIIDSFIKSLYKRERIEKKDANFNEDSIHRLLCYLACFCIEEKGTNSGISKNEIYIQFQKCANDYFFNIDLSYVLEIVVQLNIIEIQEGMYSFSHQSYLDYYYAEYERAIFG